MAALAEQMKMVKTAIDVGSEEMPVIGSPVAPVAMETMEVKAALIPMARTVVMSAMSSSTSMRQVSIAFLVLHGIQAPKQVDTPVVMAQQVAVEAAVEVALHGLGTTTVWRRGYIVLLVVVVMLDIRVTHTLLPSNSGRNGLPGHIEIQATGPAGAVHTYSERYMLRVVRYDAIDENEDGVFGPGEHLIVKNLVMMMQVVTLAPVDMIALTPNARSNAVAITQYH
jgi:hypothetical protein